MDQREPPRMTPAEGRAREPLGLEGDGPSRTRRFVRLVKPSDTRPPTPRRLAALGVGSLLAVVLLGWLGVRTAGLLWDFLRVQPAYQIEYRQIVLDPPPPAYYRGGPAPETFLENVWGASTDLRAFSTLDVDLHALTTRFQLYPWVRKVERVENQGPGRLVAYLVYREPVAVTRTTTGQPEFVVDSEGVILPRADVDFEAAGPLVILNGFLPPSPARPGQKWGRLDPDKGLYGSDEAVAAAAALAAFLRPRYDALAAALPPSSRVFLYLHQVRHDDWNRQPGFWLQITCGDRLMVFWDNPGAVPPVLKLSADQKWVILMEWVRHHPPGEDGKDLYFEFRKDGLAPYQGLAPATGMRARPGTGRLNR